jgi:hypothetical protein
VPFFKNFPECCARSLADFADEMGVSFHDLLFELSRTAFICWERIAFLESRTSAATKRFCLILVKPSHYDDDGYVIQWFRSTIPSNSLAAVYGLARDCALRKTLGEDVAIEIHRFDETNTRIRQTANAEAR